MDFGLIVITIIILALCIVPFVIMGRNSKKKEKQILQSLFDLAGKHNYTVSQFDLWNHAAIGSDEGMNMIFFTKKNKIMEAQSIFRRFRVCFQNAMISETISDKKEPRSKT